MKKIVGGTESLADCTTRVYEAAKKACEADSVCDMACDILPGCHLNMAIAAAACALAALE